MELKDARVKAIQIAFNGKCDVYICKRGGTYILKRDFNYGGTHVEIASFKNNSVTLSDEKGKQISKTEKPVKKTKGTQKLPNASDEKPS